MDHDGMRVSGPELAALLAPLPLPIAVLKRDGTLLAMSRRFEQDYGVAALQSPALHALLDDESAHWESMPLAHADGSTRPVSVYATLFRDDVLVLLAEPGSPLEATPKVTELEHRVIELERLVATDPLTGAWNRAHLDRIMAMELSRSARHQQPLSVILLDIDRFKTVNDRYGHAAGDAVLRQLVYTVQQHVRPGDMLFRWGGEEFLVLVPSTSYRQARTVAEKIRTSVHAAAFPVAGRTTVSLGVAEALPEESAHSLFARVDQALYAAKSGGRNRTAVDAQGASDAWETSVLRLAWSDEYACGNDRIDSQHRKLLELANGLIDASLREEVTQREIKDGLSALLSEVRQHFEDEEAILERGHYSRLAQHRRAHAALLKRAAQMRALADNGMLSFGTMVDFLAHDVVARHMLTLDRQYFPLFKRAAARKRV